MLSKVQVRVVVAEGVDREAAAREVVRVHPGRADRVEDRQPIIMGSQRGPDVLHLEVTHTFTNTGEVHSFVESAVVKSASGNGAVRKVIVREINRQG